MSNEKLFAVTERNSNIIQFIIKEPFKKFFEQNMPLFDIIEINPFVAISNYMVTDDDNIGYTIKAHVYEAVKAFNKPLYPKLLLIYNSSHNDINKISKILQQSTNVINNLTNPLHKETYKHIEPNMFIDCWDGTRGYVVVNKGDSLIIDTSCSEINISEIRNIHRTPKKKSSESSYRESNIIPFEDINEDTILLTYHNEYVKLLDKGIGIIGYESLRKYDETASMHELIQNSELMDYTMENANNIKLVAVKHYDGEIRVYTYDSSGVQAYKTDNTPIK